MAKFSARCQKIVPLPEMKQIFSTVQILIIRTIRTTRSEPHEADTESELSELSESELLRRFAQIDGADTESQLSELSGNELLRRFERIDAAAIEDELAGMQLLRIDNEVVQDTSSAAPAAAIHQEPKDTGRNSVCGGAVSRQSNTYCLATRRWWSTS